MDFREEARKKLQSERNHKGLTQKGRAVEKETMAMLFEMIEQDIEFAQAIAQSSSTLTECCNKIMEGVGNSISDLDVYSRAVDFYFPGAKIRYSMQIDLIGEAGAESEPTKKALIDITDLI